MVSDLVLPPGVQPPAPTPPPKRVCGIRFDCSSTGGILPLMPQNMPDPRLDKGAQNAYAILRLVMLVMCKATPRETRLVARLLDRIDRRLAEEKKGNPNV